MGNLEELEQRVANEGLSKDGLLDFMRLLPTSDAKSVKNTLQFWVDQIRSTGIAVDEDLIKRVYADLDKYGRLHPTTIQGAAPPPEVTI